MGLTSAPLIESPETGFYSNWGTKDKPRMVFCSFVFGGTKKVNFYCISPSECWKEKRGYRVRGYIKCAECPYRRTYNDLPKELKSKFKFKNSGYRWWFPLSELDKRKVVRLTFKEGTEGYNKVKELKRMGVDLPKLVYDKVLSKQEG